MHSGVQGDVQSQGGYGSGWGSGLGVRIRTASELDAAVLRAASQGGARRHQMEAITPPFPQPSIPTSASVPVAGVCSPLTTLHLQKQAGLGIDIPNHMMWPHAGDTAHPINPAFLASTARVMYSGMEGSCPLDRPFGMSPVIGMHGSNKHGDADPTGFMPLPLAPPPGLTHPYLYTNGAAAYHASEPSEDASSTITTGHADRGTRHHRKPHHIGPAAAVRVRFPDNPTATTTATATARAVSDPLAMVAAQARVREALGLPDRVRVAVSADTSLVNVGDGEGSDSTSEEEEEAAEDEEEDSLSIEIRC